MAPTFGERLRGLAARLRGQRPPEPEQPALPGIGSETQETQTAGFGSLLRRAFGRRRTGFQPPAGPTDEGFESPERGESFEVAGVWFEHEGDGWYFAWNRNLATPTNFRQSFPTPEQAVSYVGSSKDLGAGYICIRGRDGDRWSVYYADTVKRAMK